MYSVIWLFFCCAFFLLTVSGENYEEKYRPQVHYSPPSGWAGDPNGLIYAGGYYHLFYQFNPVDTTTGQTHWGHGRSTDLIHWENLPIALKPQEKNQIFNGCCVIYKRNSTVFAKNESELLLAVYTRHDVTHESQAMSFSFDDGTTWTQYVGNPVIENPGAPNFRDPNIFERDGVFYMTLAVNDRISFYSSANLITWKYLSTFGAKHDKDEDETDVWKCPSLVSLTDEQGKKHDILIVSKNVDTTGSTMQYFIGAFDGVEFKNKTEISWFENGFDNYAAIPYHNDPKGRVIVIGWMSNWMYALDTPTSTWRGQFTIPRELSLKTVDGELYVAQRPVDEINKILDSKRKWALSEPVVLKGEESIDVTSKIPFRTGSVLSIEYAIDLRDADEGKAILELGNDLGEHVAFTFDIAKNIYEFDRRNSGNVTFNILFANRVARVNRIIRNNLLFGRVVLDDASIEIFVDDGLNVFTSLFFPTEPFENIKFISNIDTSESIAIKNISVAALRSIWK